MLGRAAPSVARGHRPFIHPSPGGNDAGTLIRAFWRYRAPGYRKNVRMSVGRREGGRVPSAEGGDLRDRGAEGIHRRPQLLGGGVGRQREAHRRLGHLR
ncbi:hypothetical protein SAMN05216554_1448 [Herbiconiux ginsengi]|uniref:Uncharacterized protein n=1 Tax=Herbiconiux ginsengi TaxID=381665 RepID=A0A1H3MJ44_9MICO|nr:hypothetical protein SAMN05216554_1448 [Herbiconiux ginsengi]